MITHVSVNIFLNFLRSSQAKSNQMLNEALITVNESCAKLLAEFDLRGAQLKLDSQF